MITVNGKPVPWHDNLTFDELYRHLGYTISSPMVTTVVNGKLISKSLREGYSIPDGAEVKIINILKGG